MDLTDTLRYDSNQQQPQIFYGPSHILVLDFSNDET